MTIWHSKQKRAFHTITSGLKIGRFANKKVRFLTLTTSDIQKDSETFEFGSMNKSFQVLKKRIERTTPLRLLTAGYITNSDLRRYYNQIPINQKLRITYFKVETNEGNGVLHILYRGDYLPYNWLVDNWQDIHNSWDIDIRLLNLNDVYDTSSYVVSQYIAGQDTSYIRSSQSWQWVFHGFKSRWYNIKKSCGLSAFNVWNKVLKDIALPQTKLNDYG